MVLQSEHVRRRSRSARGTTIQSQGLDRGTEMLRWFDYWLKDIDNGIMKEPSILYWVMGAPEDKMIRSAQQWPVPQANPVKYYFCWRSFRVRPVGRTTACCDPIAYKPGSDSLRRRLRHDQRSRIALDGRPDRILGHGRQRPQGPHLHHGAVGPAGGDRGTPYHPPVAAMSGRRSRRIRLPGGRR